MSTCSTEYDENIAKQFGRTPGTPIKVTHQTPKRSNRKRSLFQPSSPVSSPSKSDDLGPMSPLSSSSDSYVDFQSPSFSPNGRFSTPPKTPVVNYFEEKCKRRKRDVPTHTFPSLKLDTPKSYKTPRTLRRSERLTPLKNKTDNSETAEDILKDVTTPPRSSTKMNISRNSVNSSNEKYLSQSIYDSTPRRSKSTIDTSPVSKLGIKTISCESFYGSAPPAPKLKTQLFIDSLGSKADVRKQTRSLSLDSLSSNKSFVSGSGPLKKRKISDTSSRPRASRKGREKGPHVGVWHGVKKPKKMKFAKNVNNSKPLISPNSRLGKMINSGKTNPIKLKSKSFHEEKPRKKNASGKGKHTPSSDDNKIFDPFPHHLIKRKKLPSQAHPSSDMQLDKEVDSPDPNKKFMKFKKTRKATLTLNENVKLQYSGGVISLQSPKKRRKLYSGKNEMMFDFHDDDVKNTEVKENIENILLKLENEKEVDAVVTTSPTKTQITKITEEQLVSILNSPRTKINIVKGSPTKVLTEIQHDSDSNISLSKSTTIQELPAQSESCMKGETKGNEIGLEETGNILSYARKILSNSDQAYTYPLPEETENEKNSGEKFFSLFYKDNWNNMIPTKDVAAVKNSNKKKSIKIPDDQYLLDAGQKSIGIVTCSKCGVMYQAGDFADEATHKNFHDHLPELRFTGWTNERIVGRFRDGRVIMILSSDPKAWWHKVRKIIDIVDQELGFPEGSVNALYYKTVYLYINDKAKQIVGCLIAEKCNEAYKMFPPLEGVDVDSCSKDPSPCKIGISRIWTALNHRRRGVAKRMIDCMRKTFIFGEVVPMDLVAFSVPSPSGKLLAQNVTGKLDFLVYGFA